MQAFNDILRFLGILEDVSFLPSHPEQLQLESDSYVNALDNHERKKLKQPWFCGALHFVGLVEEVDFSSHDMYVQHDETTG
mmetsp:Transcript_16349/g.21987  ORF Transcript_16349/g.21987 Transcript_16349/m.21987 type:complete len:81 (+) Transcript_16349:63-305(+)